MTLRRFINQSDGHVHDHNFWVVHFLVLNLQDIAIEESRLFEMRKAFVCLIKPCNVLISLPAEIQGLDTKWHRWARLYKFGNHAVPCHASNT